ncbi:NAD-dependent succinate-semialdehyde dehydrogenase [Mesorhizobium sp. 113-3-9]|uniref:aldehyde dehydrogenase family protein n=1 Tax=Mesorhizobium sp. 113-3-9 TaxID=2744517 RepID=UPI001926B867|nr:aldehyde dehydrogenase family protein [Mesorhizobium sp. 113-3-9]BCG84699.1 NAD-dependent succinate-semialdehyde dehydrogenase [Mesorhizobium sp. 113-3-9]
MTIHTNANTLLYINGRWRSGHSPSLPVVDPATEARIGTFATAGVGDLDDAVASAEQGLSIWQRTSALERYQTLTRTAELLRRRIEPIARSMTMEQGKPLAEARAEAAAAAALIDWFANEIRNGAAATATRPRTETFAQAEPIGPLAAFVAWSFPLGQAARKVSAALACGRSVVLAGPDAAPASCAALVTAFADAGLPAGVLNLVYGPQAEVAPYLVTHPAIERGSFSGPASLGARLADLAGTHGKRLVLELSGQAPAIVFDDADIGLAVNLLCKAKFRNAGQSRFAPTHILVQDSVHGRFLDDFIEAMKRIPVGNGFQDGIEMGPLTGEHRIRTMEAAISNAQARSAVVVAGGHRMGNFGYFFWPTALTQVTPEAGSMDAEPFGPIVVISRFDRYETAIEGVSRLRPMALHAHTTSKTTTGNIRRDVASDFLFFNQRDNRALSTPLGDIIGGAGHDDTLEGYAQARLINQSA